jgi:hypothetical protein
LTAVRGKAHRCRQASSFHIIDHIVGDLKRGVTRRDVMRTLLAGGKIRVRQAT